MAGSWRPILEGSVAERALAAAQGIARGAVAMSSEPSAETALLKQGCLGAVLLVGELRAAGGPDLTDAGSELLDRALTVLAEEPLAASLYFGFTGIAWVAQATGALEPDDEGLAVIDEAIASMLAGAAGDLPFDLMDGLAGIGIYALARLPRPAARQAAERIVELLDARAQPARTGIFWRCEPDQLIPLLRASYPHGHVMTGLSHGVAGAIGFLAAAVERGVAAPRASALLEGAIGWIAAQREPDGRFVLEIVPGRDRLPAPDAWCHGRPGIAAALWRAGAACDRGEWRSMALEAARSAATRPDAVAEVRDAALCHGAAGLGHIYNRLFQASGDESLGDAARTWLARALELQREGDEIGGFPAWDGRHDPPWLPDPGYLTGAAGVGLALVAACSDREPTWDAPLLLDLRPA